MMRVHRARGGVWSAVVIALALAVSGCASSSILLHRSGSQRPVGQDGPPAPEAQLAVVRHWAAALQTGDLRTAAGFFHLPSLFENGPQATGELHSLAQAEFANATLSCGAKVISAFQKGQYIDVLFRLTVRAGRGGGVRGCGSGAGQTARTEFLIRDGHILAWVRAPSLPGDPGVPRTTGPSQPHTQSQTQTGPLI